MTKGDQPMPALAPGSVKSELNAPAFGQANLPAAGKDEHRD
jgi:hypothetical protein